MVYTFVKSGLLLARGAMLRLVGVQTTATASTTAMAGAQRGLGAATLSVGKATMGAGRAVKILKFALISSGIGAIVVGLGMAAAYLIENWETVGPALGRIASKAGGFLKKYLWDENPLMFGPRLIVQEWDSISLAVGEVYEKVKEKFAPVSDIINELKGAWDYFFGDDGDKTVTLAAAPPEAAQPIHAAVMSGRAPLPHSYYAQAAGGAAASAAAQAPPTPSISGKLSPPPSDIVASQPERPIVPSFQYQPMAASSSYKHQPPEELSTLMNSDAAAMGAEFDHMLSAVTQMGGSPMFQGMPFNYDMTSLPGLGQPVTPEIKNETNITMDLRFDVKGLDEGEFRKKINNYKGEFEKIVRRVVGQMESTQTRV